MVGEDGIVELASLESTLESFGLTAVSVGVVVALVVMVVVVGVLLVPNPEDDVDDLETVPIPEKEEEAPPNVCDAGAANARLAARERISLAQVDVPKKSLTNAAECHNPADTWTAVYPDPNTGGKSA
eukprot:scaffold44917_cov89-Attheya_sp.AAC.1